VWSMNRIASKESIAQANLEYRLVDRKATVRRETPEEQKKREGWKLFSGSSNPSLALSVAEHLGVGLAPLICSRFNDGECNIQVTESVRNTNVFIVQSTSLSRDGSRTINDNVMELLLLVRCMRRASAKAVTAIIPYYGYGRQDEKRRPRVPIAASDIAMLFEAAGISKVVTVDLHSPQIQGQFQHCPVDNLSMFDDFAQFFVNEISGKMDEDEEIVVVSPDAFGVARANYMLELLRSKGVQNASLATIIKQKTVSSITITLVGEVAGMHCVIVDDTIETGQRICTTAESLLAMGAKTVGAIATHGIFTGRAIKKLEASDVDYVIVSDTIALPPNLPELSSKIMPVSCAALLSEAIDSILHNEQITHLFAIGKE